MRISVIDPILPAFERVKETLFRPFDLRKWFVIGFCAWLATLGRGGGGGGGGGVSSPPTGGGKGGGGGGGDFKDWFEQARQWVMQNLDWLLPLAVFLIVLGVAFGVAVLWLSSRGRFMFLHCVAKNVAEVAAPWRAYKLQGHSLFLFRLCVTLVGVVVFVTLLASVGFAVVPKIVADGVRAAPIITLIVAGLVVMVLGVGFGLIGLLTEDFIVPIMYLRSASCLEAWSEFKSMISPHVGALILYVLFQIVIHIAIAVVTMVVVVVTCCIAGCLLAIPYLGTVLFLPILVFQRAYSIHFLAQFGAEYDVFELSTDSGQPSVEG